MVPGSFGCGSLVFAAIATLAPSRAARSPMASPMPREAPVMNRVFPLSGIGASLFAGEEGGESRPRLVRLQQFAEMLGFAVDLFDHRVEVAAHQGAGRGDGLRRQACDFARCGKRRGVDLGAVD